MTVKVRVGGAWKSITQLCPKIAILYKQIVSVSVRVEGAWRATAQSIIQSWIKSDATSKPGYANVDGAGNVYVTGYYSIMKYNSAGVLQWTNSAYSYCRESVVDSAGNFYMLANDVLVKLNSAGVFQWQNNTYAYANGIAIDAVGNVYVGYHDITLCVIKFNSSGGIVWICPSAYTFVSRLCVDSAFNVFVAVSESIGNPNLIKINSAGVIQWTKTTFDVTIDVGVDLSGSIYIFSLLDPPDGPTLRKLNSSGVEIWKKTGMPRAVNMKIDIAGNIYIACANAAGSVNLQKYNTYGVLLWSLTDTGNCQWVFVDSKQAVYACYNDWAAQNIVRKLLPLF